MCGIHGVAAVEKNLRFTAEDVQAMADISVHRGPDDSGMHADPNVIIGMRRLSIIDVAGGHQPIANADNTTWVVCNGEIYNYQKLRQELIDQGVHFKTHSDTEVIVHLYDRYGLAFVERIQGMFGFAIWDQTRQRLVIGRDRLGIKPVYYRHADGNLAFASELKSILALPGISRSFDTRALNEYLRVGYVPDPFSIIAGIRKLSPGTLLVNENGAIRTIKYWHIQQRSENKTEEQWCEAFRDALDQSVSAQMVSDVPLGAFLSGGIDSSAVVAMMAAHSEQPIKTFSIGFGESSGGRYYNELPYAQQIARQFATDHKEIVVEPSVVDLMPRLLWHMDEPIADTAFVTTYLVSEFARREVTVILSGVGGDELFGGYRRYLGDYYLRTVKWLPSSVRRKLIKPLMDRLPADRHSPLMNLSRYAKALLDSSELSFEERYISYVSVMAEQQVNELLIEPAAAPVESALAAAFNNFRDGDGVNRMMQLDLATQLPDDLLMLTDRMSMAASLECRVPLLDERMVDLAMAMPGAQKIRGRELKRIMKKALAPILPDNILHRKKRGFGAPMGAWFRHELKPMLDHLLSESAVIKRGLFHPSAVRQLVAEHYANRADRTDQIMSLLNLEIWSRMYLDGRSHDDVHAELKEVA
ncbi:MAG: asparagine synthase (glutamine-hydrolyzing) [Gammaproteobacteria bacterium]|nr:asparagine synthase (glutamine-hydrolyzing) [Gammaproteobacteria bacterium]